MTNEFRFNQTNGELFKSSPSSLSSNLNKILCKEAKSQNFLVGSVGHQDSLLGKNELDRNLPNGKVTLLVATWNMNGKTGPCNFGDLLLPDNVNFMPDLYAIGIQESPGQGNGQELRDLEIDLQATIGPSHVIIRSASLGALYLSIFLRRDLIWFISSPEYDVYNCRVKATNIVRTKGAVSISFSIFGTTFLFVNCHLPAHVKKNQERLDEYEKICQTLNLPRNLKPLKPCYLSNNVTSRFDCVFWFGDLNFRIQQNYLEVIQKLSKNSFDYLLNDDQLLNAIDNGYIFHGFQEAGLIKFAPTYKYQVGSDKFDELAERVPSYTDRILFRSKKPNQIKCLIYDSASSFKTSDHKPVYAFFETYIKPGRDDVPLNAGAFNRKTYLQGLKKRAQATGQFKFASTSFCSLS